MAATAPILVVPDVHQNVAFLDAALDLGRREGCATVVLLGDLFDGRRRETATASALAATLGRVRALRAGPGPAVHVLLGNHDFRYERVPHLVEQALAWDGGTTSDFALDCHLAQVLPENLQVIAHVGTDGRRLWDDDDWSAMRGPILLDGHLFSHAGVHPAFWPEGPAEPDDKVAALASRWEAERRVAREGRDPPLFRAGAARGGSAPQGGPLWLDWSREFVDGLPVPQVVGHSAGKDVRRIGRSTCLDAVGTAVGILEGGRLRVMRLEG